MVQLCKVAGLLLLDLASYLPARLDFSSRLVFFCHQVPDELIELSAVAREGVVLKSLAQMVVKDI